MKGVDVDALRASVDRYIRRPVTISGRVTRITGPTVVVLENRLPVAADDLPADLRASDTLCVTRPFSRFGMQQFERDRGVDLGDQAFAEFRGQPAIAADEVVTP